MSLEAYETALNSYRYYPEPVITLAYFCFLLGSSQHGRKKEWSRKYNIHYIIQNGYPYSKQANDQKAVQIRTFPIYNYVVLESYERQPTDLGIKSIWASINPLNIIKIFENKSKEPYNQDFSP